MKRCSFRRRRPSGISGQPYGRPREFKRRRDAQNNEERSSCLARQHGSCIELQNLYMAVGESVLSTTDLV